jgi:hypothetical protein
MVGGQNGLDGQNGMVEDFSNWIHFRSASRSTAGSAELSQLQGDFAVTSKHNHPGIFIVLIRTGFDSNAWLGTASPAAGGSVGRSVGGQQLVHAVTATEN